MWKLLNATADRIGGVMSMAFFVGSLVMISDAPDVEHVFWGLLALALSCVAMWSFLVNGDSDEGNE